MVLARELALAMFQQQAVVPEVDLFPLSLEQMVIADDIPLLDTDSELLDAFPLAVLDCDVLPQYDSLGPEAQVKQFILDLRTHLYDTFKKEYMLQCGVDGTVHDYATMLRVHRASYVAQLEDLASVLEGKQRTLVTRHITSAALQFRDHRYSIEEEARHAEEAMREQLFTDDEETWFASYTAEDSPVATVSRSRSVGRFEGLGTLFGLFMYGLSGLGLGMAGGGRKKREDAKDGKSEQPGSPPSAEIAPDDTLISHAMQFAAGFAMGQTLPSSDASSSSVASPSVAGGYVDAGSGPGMDAGVYDDISTPSGVGSDGGKDWADLVKGKKGITRSLGKRQAEISLAARFDGFLEQVVVGCIEHGLDADVAYRALQDVQTSRYLPYARDDPIIVSALTKISNTERAYLVSVNGAMLRAMDRNSVLGTSTLSDHQLVTQYIPLLDTDSELLASQVSRPHALEYLIMEGLIPNPHIAFVREEYAIARESFLSQCESADLDKKDYLQHMHTERARVRQILQDKKRQGGGANEGSIDAVLTKLVSLFKDDSANSEEEASIAVAEGNKRYCLALFPLFVDQVALQVLGLGHGSSTVRLVLGEIRTNDASPFAGEDGIDELDILLRDILHTDLSLGDHISDHLGPMLSTQDVATVAARDFLTRLGYITEVANSGDVAPSNKHNRFSFEQLQHKQETRYDGFFGKLRYAWDVITKPRSKWLKRAAYTSLAVATVGAGMTLMQNDLGKHTDAQNYGGPEVEQVVIEHGANADTEYILHDTMRRAEIGGLVHSVVTAFTGETLKQYTFQQTDSVESSRDDVVADSGSLDQISRESTETTTDSLPSYTPEGKRDPFAPISDSGISFTPTTAPAYDSANPAPWYQVKKAVQTEGNFHYELGNDLTGHKLEIKLSNGERMYRTAHAIGDVAIPEGITVESLGVYQKVDGRVQFIGGVDKTDIQDLTQKNHELEPAYSVPV
jgi:hypothetical protein